MEENSTTSQVTITGTVTPNKWDDYDNIIAVAISTDDKDYVVEVNRLGAELFDFLDENVEVTGLLKKDLNGTTRIKVFNYELVASESA